MTATRIAQAAVLALVGSLGSTLAPATAQEPPRPDRRASFVSWFDARFERMPMAEEAWQEVAWVTDFKRARELAALQGRPIFCWSMNGNPLGCT